jgi:cyclophilin family peptidyl-prolyl cis-trans isomerase/HEAT repeat protein
LTIRSCIVAILLAVAPAPAQTPAAPPAARLAMLAAEDARLTDRAALESVLASLKSPNPNTQRLAVRVLGRLERREFVDDLIPLLAARSRDVRAEAANALAQSFGLPDTPPADAPPADAAPDPVVSTVNSALIARLKVETDPIARGAVAESIGRLPFRTADEVAAAAAALGSVVGTGPAAARRAEALVGMAKGLEALVRSTSRIAPASPDVVDRLEQLAGMTTADPRVRRLAMSGLIAAKAVDQTLVETAVQDRDPQVRRLGVIAAGALPAGADKDRLIAGGLHDAEAMVRYDALRMHGALGDRVDCQLVLAAIADSSSQVALLAIDLLGSACRNPESVAALTILAGGSLARTPSMPPMAPVLTPSLGLTPSWHARAHAIVGLTRSAPERARELLPRLGVDPVWQVRMYVARAATVLREGAWLERLARDVHDNVREAALVGLQQVAGRDGDRTFLEALGRPDYQLVRTAALALKGTPARRETVAALLAALERITADRRETSRDPRLAILERLREIGAPGDAPALRKYVEDFDPAVAEVAAAIVSAWTKESVPAAPKRLQPAPLPDAKELASLAGASVRFVIRSRGEVVLRLLPADAPLTCARFVRLVRAGHYNGLTFHRVVPNFVVQGGSPGANEYMGDGPYLRDEVGLRPHLRGSVGVSTRGRDTGDAQIFVDLVDLPRLDHVYTVFAEVSGGFETLDAIVEGDVIERAELVPPR